MTNETKNFHFQVLQFCQQDAVICSFPHDEVVNVEASGYECNALVGSILDFETDDMIKTMKAVGISLRVTPRNSGGLHHVEIGACLKHAPYLGKLRKLLKQGSMHGNELTRDMLLQTMAAELIVGDLPQPYV